MSFEMAKEYCPDLCLFFLLLRFALPPRPSNLCNSKKKPCSSSHSITVYRLSVHFSCSGHLSYGTDDGYKKDLRIIIIAQHHRKCIHDCRSPLGLDVCMFGCCLYTLEILMIINRVLTVTCIHEIGHDSG